jgi:branched-chain amino acid transport system ATP-binding protein
MSVMLSIRNLEAGYHAGTVLNDLDLEIAKGEVLTVLGRNGMGKSTLVRAIMGKVRIRKGTVTFGGVRIENWQPHRIGQAGIAIVPEGRQIFPNLTVKENLVAFACNRSKSQDPWTLDHIYRLFPRLSERQNNMGNQLSGGEQQMLAIGRALMTNPTLLILDEATEGLAPLVREEIWTAISTLRSRGQTMIAIDKHVDRLIDVADRHLILEGGRMVWLGSSTQLRGDRDLWHRYLGV